MTGFRDELANALAKLSSIDDRKTEVEKHLALEHRFRLVGGLSLVGWLVVWGLTAL